MKRRTRLEFADGGLDRLPRIIRNHIAFVQQQHVAELDLVDQHLGQRALRIRAASGRDSSESNAFQNP